MNPLFLRRTVVLNLAWAALLFLPCGGHAMNLTDLASRIVPIQIDQEALASPNVLMDEVTPETAVTVLFTLDNEAGAYNYGLFVPSASDTAISLNGRHLDTDPYHASDGDLLQIPRESLVSGTNVLEITRTPATATSSWVGLTMFSLSNTSEEVHFSEMFSEARSRTTQRLAEAPPYPASQDQFDVLYYDCYWEPSMSASSLTSATVLMRAKVTNGPLQTIGLDFDTNAGAMVVSRVDQGPGTSALTPSLDTTNNWLTVTLPTALATGQEFQLRIGYSGTPRASFTGYLARPYTRSTHGSSVPVVYTASQPYGARRWWPCKDRPDDKATTTIQRIGVPSGLGYQVMSNGVKRSVTAGPTAGLETWVWESTYPITTYLVAFSVSNYTYSNGVYTSRDGQTTMPIVHAIYPENSGSEGNGAAGTLDVLNYFADTFGEYPYLSEKYGTASWNISFGIEHQTGTGMPGANQGVSESVGDGRTRRNMHELAHMWYGDKVTYATFDHVWLGEAFATYAEALWQEHASGSAAYHTYVNNWTYTITDPIVDPVADGYDTYVTYRRGAWVLHMLRHTIGEAAFFQTLKNWATPPSPATPQSGYRSAYSAQFQQTAEAASGMNLSAFFAQWLYRPDTDGATLPDYRFEGSSSKTGSDYNVAFGIEQLQTGSVPFTMPLDVKVTMSDGSSTVAVIQNASKTLASYNINVGASRPVEVDLDPDNWVLNNQHASVNTVGLPPAATGIAYSRTLRASGGSGTYTWTKTAGPAWLTVSSGVLSGTPPTAGSYSVTIQFQEAGVSARTFTLSLDVSDPPPPPPVVINEVLFDVYNVTDAGEYIELYNTSTTPADISGWQVVLVNGGTGTSYATITIPASTVLAGNDYYVIGNSTTLGAVYPGVVDQNYNLDNAIQDGPADAIVLKSSLGVRVDSLNYMADTVFGTGAETANALAEGGTGRATSKPIAQSTQQIVLGRFPNGVDTGNNLNDFACIPASPGAANVPQFTMPFTDDFNSGSPNAAWRGAFVNPRTVDPTASGKPGIASPAGGQVLEVVDTSGGGDTAFLPAAVSQINFEGYLWTPQDITLTTTGWSTGVGIDTRDDSAWFSNSAGLAIEHGFYLEYQNGTLNNTSPTTLKGGAIPAHAGVMKFYAINGNSAVNVGNSSVTVNELGSYTVPAGSRNAWNTFRLEFDRPANRVAAIFAGVTLYDGVIPPGNFASAGGVVVGFREIHSGSPNSGNREGTWVDGIKVNTNGVPVTMSHFEME